MASVLETCCGSPAYAAPELVTGQNYLGSEADIWSMGVLLYALLCGFLPFDDENISALYRKIQLGVYEKPNWLSKGSIDLLHCMLQTDPKRRITVDQLLVHPWMMDGYERPVKWQSKYHTSDFDVDIIGELAVLKMCSKTRILEKLKQLDYSSNMLITYFILSERKSKGVNWRLTSETVAAGTPKRSLLKELNNGSGNNSLGNSPRGLHNSLEGGLDDAELLNIGSPVAMKDQENPPVTKSNASGENFERTKNRASERYPIPNKKKAEDKENLTPSKITKPTVVQYPMQKESPLSPSRSMDSGLNEQQGPKTPKYTKKSGRLNDDWIFATPDRPIGARASGSGAKSNRKVLGSIERGLDKMKNMLTPRKSRVHSYSDTPALVTGKALCNVSTTSQHNPDAVLNDLAKALSAKGIPCQQKGYILRGKIKDSTGFAKLSFELEVCRIPNLNVVGIRRKRLKGDAWCYKKVCEEVLRLAEVGKN